MDYIKELINIVGEKNVKTDLPERLCYSRTSPFMKLFRMLLCLQRAPKRFLRS